ncbi:MAG TPA: hypothetical protein VFN27_16550 [Xanthobacteraceae bacterium]|nr:hypothetical protein [Xanthobacteraceae bacterium]
MKRIFLALAALLLAALPASSQIAWPTPVGTMAAVGSVAMCLNPGGVAIPVSAAGSCGSQVNAVATGTTAAVTATIPAVAAKTNFLCTLDVSELQTATAGSFSVTVSGLLGGTFTYQGSNAASAASTLSRTFTPCLVGSAVNTAIVVTAAANANGAAVDVNVSGYLQ